MSGQASFPPPLPSHYNFTFNAPLGPQGTPSNSSETMNPNTYSGVITTPSRTSEAVRLPPLRDMATFDTSLWREPGGTSTSEPVNRRESPPASPAPRPASSSPDRRLAGNGVTGSSSTDVAPLVLRPGFVDALAKDFGLDRHYSVKLHAFVGLGSSEPALSRPDLATRTYTLAAIFALINTCKRSQSASQDTGVDDLPGLFNDLKIRLEDTFNLTKEQRENIRAITQDMIYQANRVTFKALADDVEKHLRGDQAMLRLTNIFGSPFREKILSTHLKRVASSVRNAFRQDIRDSISGDKKCSLKDFTFQSAVKYKRGGPGDRLDVGYTIHNRRFALDNPELLNIDESEDGNDSSSTPPAADSTTGPARKKRKTTAGGRVPRGEDFWSRVDRHLASYVISYGRNLASVQWKGFIDDIIRRDESNFPHAVEPWLVNDSTEPAGRVTTSTAAQHVTHERLQADPGPSSGTALRPGRNDLLHLLSA
ncbi:hypothetical protein OH77DRAFT_1511597 [Trametes cingulata]|nr:hypothetical protein OH77DRAFT_1511597 [Trametes cingulata]